MRAKAVTAIGDTLSAGKEPEIPLKRGTAEKLPLERY